MNVGAPTIPSFFRIAERWHLRECEQLAILGIKTSKTLHQWQAGRFPPPRRETVERISLVMRIQQRLERSSSDPIITAHWLRAPNKLAPFRGRSPIKVMAGGTLRDLDVVLEHLEAQG